MTDADRLFLERINNYANEVMPDIDPQKTQISFQLEKLMPLLRQISEEENQPIETIFIRYMDLASEAFVATSKKMNEKMEGLLDPRGNVDFH